MHKNFRLNISIEPLFSRTYNKYKIKKRSFYMMTPV
nr:MAG TPA: hypothetical protein [Caudoviricetes sp.]